MYSMACTVNCFIFVMFYPQDQSLEVGLLSQRVNADVILLAVPEFSSTAVTLSNVSTNHV